MTENLKKIANFCKMMTWENRSFTLFYPFETTKKVFLHAVKLCIIIPFFSLHDDMRFHPLSRELIQYYLVSWHKNCLKDPVSTKTGFIFLFYCPTVSLETDKEKWQVLWPIFGKKVEIFGQFHETVIASF